MEGKHFLNLKINNNNDLFALFRFFNMHVLTGNNLYCFSKLMIRFPICEDPALILSAMKRLQQLAQLITEEPCPELLALPSVTSLINAPSSIAPTISHSIDLPVMEKRIKKVLEQLKNTLITRSEEIIQILTDYQAISVTSYELERSIRTLSEMSIHDLIIKDHIESAVVMLPSNLPLYSLIVFAVIPSFLSQKIFVRPNSILQQNDIISRLSSVLELQNICPGICVINENRDKLLPYIRQADLVVFTGKPKNAEIILSGMKENAILVVNGAGHNPLVITESADIDAAVDGALLVKGFNGGQDCAGPDAILVHSSIAEKFIQRFTDKFTKLKMGSFNDPSTVIGQIHRFDELQRISRIMHENRTDILAGGKIDFSLGMVEPTVIVRGVERRPNYNELYSPIAFIHPYKTDQDLAIYFEDPDGNYRANRMYVSLYGHSPYLESRDDTLKPSESTNVGIVLHNTTIHDVEIGYKPYGGYSLGASAIIKKSPGNKIERKACPILLPQVIINFLIEKQPLHSQQSLINESNAATFFSPSTRTDKQLDPIVKIFQEAVSRIFGSNLLFGFIFGSAAKNGLKVKRENADDLDTFICINEDNPNSIQQYLTELSTLHTRFGLKIDTNYPAEILTHTRLNKVLSMLSKIDVSIDKMVTGDEFDSIFWAHTLTDKKMSFVGNNATMNELIRLASPHIKRWSMQILEQLKSQQCAPDYLKSRFPGLELSKIIQKLEKMSAHAIVHLGLLYDTSSPSAVATPSC